MSIFSRKKLFVNRGIQGTLALYLAGYWVLHHIAIWHVAFIYFFIRERIAQLGGGVSRTIDEMYSHFVTQYSPLTVGACLLLPLVVYEMVRQSHRVAGPLVRFTHALKRMTAGEIVAPIRLRDGDLLTDFEKVFNEFLAVHNTRMEQLKKAESDKGSPDEYAKLESLEIEVPEEAPLATVEG